MTDPVIRSARPEDVPTLLALIRELAAYERLSDEVVATEADLLRDGFGPQPRFFARIAEIGGRPAGFTLAFYNYSTFRGRAGIYLEDFYVAEWARGRGLGRRLIADLAAFAVESGAVRLDLSVLDWNPARGFYEKLGLRRNDGWLPYRIAGEALAQLAGKSLAGK